MSGPNQSDRQASVRTYSGTSLNYEGDWLALFNLLGVADGDYNGRMIGFINQTLASTYPDLNGAQYAFAANSNAGSWNELGTFTLSGILTNAFTLENTSGFLMLEDGTSYLLQEA